MQESGTCRNPTQLGKQHRDELAVLFASEFGLVAWQEHMAARIIIRSCSGLWFLREEVEMATTD